MVKSIHKITNQLKDKPARPAGGFRNKYRTGSARLKNWDYGRDGVYFVTICTGGRECYFGDIEEIEIKLSETGLLADRTWLEIPDKFDFIELDEYIVMPNHIHGILKINKTGDYRKDNMSPDLKGNVELRDGRDAINRVSTVATNDELNLNNETQKGGITGIKNPMLHDNLSRVIRWYKGRLTFDVRKFNLDFCWQPRYYDIIIRDNKALNNTRNYIKDNPKNWSRDKLNPPFG
jgi:REP element-mobilizing transposase RayT